MRRSSQKFHLKAAEPFLPDAGVTCRRRFCNQAVHRFEHFFYQEVAHTVLTTSLFVADERKNSRQFPSLFNEHLTGTKKRGNPTLHVCCTPPPHITVTHATRKGRMGPSLIKCRHDINMSTE